MFVIGLVCFVLGVNLGFLAAGLMHSAKDGQEASERLMR